MKTKHFLPVSFPSSMGTGWLTSQWFSIHWPAEWITYTCIWSEQVGEGKGATLPRDPDTPPEMNVTWRLWSVEVTKTCAPNQNLIPLHSALELCSTFQPRLLLPGQFPAGALQERENQEHRLQSFLNAGYRKWSICAVGLTLTSR